MEIMSSLIFHGVIKNYILALALRYQADAYEKRYRFLIFTISYFIFKIYFANNPCNAPDSHIPLK